MNACCTQVPETPSAQPLDKTKIIFSLTVLLIGIVTATAPSFLVPGSGSPWSFFLLGGGTTIVAIVLLLTLSSGEKYTVVLAIIPIFCISLVSTSYFGNETTRVYFDSSGPPLVIRLSHPPKNFISEDGANWVVQDDGSKDILVPTTIKRTARFERMHADEWGALVTALKAEALAQRIESAPARASVAPADVEKAGKN